MFITTRALSGKRKINRAVIYRTMRKYSIEYCITAHELCQRGYSSTPYKVDEDDFKLAIMQEFPTEGHLFMSPLSAKLSFGQETMKYVSYVTEYKELKTLLKLYMRYKKAEYSLGVCKNALDELKFKMNGDAEVNVRLIVSEGIQDKTRITLLPEFLFMEDNEKIQKVSLGTPVIEQLCYEIGLSEAEYRSHYRTGQPFFIKGVTQSQESDIASSIVRGLVTLDGKYGDRLLKSMVKYYEDYFKHNSQFSTVQGSFDNLVYIHATQGISSYLNLVRQTVHKNGGSELYIDNDYVYYQYKKPVDKGVPSKINVGGVCNIPETKELFEGIQGVFTAKPAESINTIPMYIDEYGVIYLNTDAYYKDYTLEEVLAECNCDTEEELKLKIRCYTKSPLTYELALALAYAICGENTKALNFSSEEYSITDYKKSCEEAISIMRYNINLL